MSAGCASLLRVTMSKRVSQFMLYNVGSICGQWKLGRIGDAAAPPVLVQKDFTSVHVAYGESFVCKFRGEHVTYGSVGRECDDGISLFNLVHHAHALPPQRMLHKWCCNLCEHCVWCGGVSMHGEEHVHVF